MFIYYLKKPHNNMEKRINKKIEQYMCEFKDNVRKQIDMLDKNAPELNKLLQYVYDYDRLVLEKDDFCKKKRVKNNVPYYDRCCAKKSSGEQCTRRKKCENVQYCGTHLKGLQDTQTLHDPPDPNGAKTRKMEVWIQEIKGILYYIDKENNVYQAEDIINNVNNPKIIAKYVKVGDVYTIPDLKL